MCTDSDKAASDRRRAAVAVGALIAVISSTAHAADGLQATVAATSDYVYRGISQSAGKRALQGSLSAWSATGMYAGVWASEIDTVNRDLYPYARPGGALAE